MNRKKVKFSLTRYSKKGSYRFMGYGEIDENNLYTKKKVYEDCIKNCHKMLNKSNEYKGSFYQYETIEFVNDRNNLVELELEVDYDLWFRILN